LCASKNDKLYPNIFSIIALQLIICPVIKKLKFEIKKRNRKGDYEIRRLGKNRYKNRLNKEIVKRKYKIQVRNLGINYKIFIIVDSAI
jgi:hypothetical protein